jgi:uncharacterized repeat protein (TIGR03899 family)
MKVNDILGIGKILPIDKLIDVVTSISGKVSKSYFDKKDIKTKALEIKLLAEARAEELKIMVQAINQNQGLTGSINYSGDQINITSPRGEAQTNSPNSEATQSEILDRAIGRMLFQQLKSQLNIEAVTANTAEILKDEPAVSAIPIDEDWKTRFFKIVEDVSDDEMQIIWARILAGEIKEPKSFSLRTLELLKNLTKHEAEIFTKFAELRLKSEDHHFILNGKEDEFLKMEMGIRFMDILLMTELGLIASEDILEFSFEALQDSPQTELIEFGTKGFLFHREAFSGKHGVQVLVLTKMGVELSKLIPQKTNSKYIELICSSFKSSQCRIECGDLSFGNEGEPLITNKVEYVG